MSSLTTISAPWIDEKYVRLIGHSVDRFTVVSDSPLSVNFRCPICGDSKKSKTKARGYVFRVKDGTFRYKCHNCGDSRTLRSLIKTVDYNLYREYVSETLVKPREDTDVKISLLRKKTEEDSLPGTSLVLKIPSLRDLPRDHEAVQYWTERMLPEKRMSDAYWASAFYSWVNHDLIPDKFTSAALDRDCGRIVLPFRNREKKITAVTGRSVADEKPKYVSVRLTETPSLFGEELIDERETVYVLEGPIDSMFLKNAVGMGTSSRSVRYEDRVMVYDNEPRSPEIVKIVERAVAAGERVVVWPPDVTEKDINQMVLAGRDPAAIVRARTFSGLRARIELGNWRRDR